MIAARTTMRSAILVEPKRIELRGVPMPQPAPGAIVVRVRAALTDGTDLKAFRRGHPQMPMPTPFGHEFSGDVAAVGEGVTKFSAGEPVMSVHSAPCGSCYWCERGEEELCESVMATKILGAYAEYIEIPKHIVERNCYAKPEGLSYACAAFLEPLSCVVHSLDFANISAGSSVVVMGDGGFGLLHAALLAYGGMRPILAGRREERLRLAHGLGVTQTINARKEDVAQRVRELTRGRGADALIECTGSEEVWEAAPVMVRRGGIVSFFGGLPSSARVSFLAARMHYDEVRLISPFHFTPGAVRRAYDLLSSRAIDPAALVTESVSLDRIGDVFERLDAGEGIKFAIQP
ncbi:MAG TPA: alcohol dehydrogenase catalytic domain-containing protein [Candidatus Baltobacteraceae bacterium]|nr:alcohol dehydrogenase catalytic domain-containing protein [Candidatus Baltobacteraceae bacterium]